jgi:hypothetical protein
VTEVQPDGPSPPARPWWRRRWPWLLAGFVAAALFVLPYAVRSRGRAHLAATRARLAAGGFGASLEDLRRGAPEVDPSTQARWRAVVARAVSMDRPALRGKAAEWAAGNAVAEPPGARTRYEQDGELRAEAAATLAEGPVTAGGLGSWLAGGGGPIQPAYGVRCENLLGVKGLADLFDMETMFAADPGPALASLDRMHAAFARPGTLIDGMIGLVVAGRRDETCARLALRGRLPREAGDRWLAEEPVEPFRVAESLRGERLLFLGPILEGLESGRVSPSTLGLGSRTSFAQDPGAWMEGRAASSGWWLHGFEAGARVLEYYAGMEEALRKGRRIPPMPTSDGGAGQLTWSMSGNMTAVAMSALLARQSHRLARLFVRVVRMAGEPGGLPADAAALRARLGASAAILDFGPMDYPIVFERPAPDRFRLRADVSGPPLPTLEGIGSPEVPKPTEGKQPFLWKQLLVEAQPPR